MMLFALVLCASCTENKGSSTPYHPVIPGQEAWSTASSKNLSYLKSSVEKYIDMGSNGIQSLALNPKDSVIYVTWNQNQKIRVYDWRRNGSLKKLISKDYTGHNNDMCLDGDLIWIVGTEESNLLYKYDIKTAVVTPVDVKALMSTNLVGVTVYDSSTLLLVCYAGSTLSVWKMSKSTGVISQFFTDTWDKYLCQGCHFVNGRLYVMTNASKEENVGTTILVYNVDQKTRKDEINIPFEGESEGVDSAIENGSLYIYFGAGNTLGKFSYICKFKDLY